MRITEPDVLTRAWGTEQIVAWTSIHACKILRRNPNTESETRGFQLHVKEESHFLYEGRMRLDTLHGDEVTSIEIGAGFGWTVPPGTFHRETALTDCVIIEVSDPTREDRFRSGADYGGLASMSDVDAIDKLYDFAQALRTRALECEALAAIIAADGLRAIAE